MRLEGVPILIKTCIIKRVKLEKEYICMFQLVEEFRLLSREIVSLPVVAHFAMVHLDCEELKQGLARKARGFAQALLEKLVAIHRQESQQ